MAKQTARSNPLDEFSAERDERPSAETVEKLQWVLQQYDALLPDGQAAVDVVLLALVRRPVSELSPWSALQAALRVPPT